jgi:cytochrome c oxidase assembly factor CtaG
MCFTVLFCNRFLHINTVATLPTILVFILAFLLFWGVFTWNPGCFDVDVNCAHGE